jgi:predicted PurR-regulated permease PerM
MKDKQEILREFLNRDLIDVMVRVGLIALVVVLCVQVIAPFAALMVWALILAVTLYPLYKMLLKRLGGREGRAATVIVVAGLLLIGVPTVMLGSSFAGQLHDMYTALDNNEVTVPPPPPSVSEWPVVGKKLYSFWNSAATNLPALLEKMQPQLGNFLKSLFSLVGSTAGGILSFLGSLIIAGIMMAYGESGSAAMRRIISRVAGPIRGPRLHSLSTATIRSVATGVVGVAFIQALLLGIGFLLAGIPAAGMLAVLVMLLGIMQLPALIISLPAIGFLWWAGDSSTVLNIIFTIYLIVAGMADNVLKPLLLGRGVDVPMPVILLGALGGMVSGGIVGLFVGAVLLAIGYQVFMEWVDDVSVSEPETTGQAATDSE